MDFAPTGPLASGSLLWRTRRGPFAMTVVCKATFTLSPGQSWMAPAQEPAHERDLYTGQDPARWVRAPADLVPYKVRADVVLVGHAYSPDGQPARRVRARLAISGIDKSIEVWADRRRCADGRVLEGAPQPKLALGWDRAALTPDNPAGVSVHAAPDAYGTVPLPAIVWPEGDPRARSGAAAGFGPLAPFWPGRVEKLGAQRSAALPSSGWHGAAIQEDADDAAFQASPPDQQLSALEAEPRLVLENLHASHPRLETALGRVLPQAVVERSGRAPEPLRLVADTLWIDTDRGICTVTWRASLMLSHAAEAGVVRLWPEGIELAPRRSEIAPERSPRRAPTSGFDPRGTSAVDPALVANVRATPFDAPARPGPLVQKPPPPVFGHPPPPALSPPASFGASGGWDPRGTSAVDPAILAQRPPTPFVPVAEGAPPPAFPEKPPAPPNRFDPRETRVADATVPLDGSGALPFPAPAREVSLPPAQPPTLPAASREDAALPSEVPAPACPTSAPATVAPIDEDETPPAGTIEIAPFDVRPPEWVGPAPTTSAPTVETTAAASTAHGAPPEEESTTPRPTSKREEIEALARDGESLDGRDFSNLDLAGIRLDGVSLIGASFERSDLTGASLQRAVLTAARLGAAVLERADLRGATMGMADLTGADMRAADLTRAMLEKAMLHGARCSGAVFDSADIAGGRLNDADVTGASFCGARLEAAHLRAARCAGAIFVSASLKRVVADRADLSGADLTRADLEKASLRDAVLRATTLAEAKLDGADLRGADLSNAKAPRATMIYARTDGMKTDGAEGL
ncbi:MAG: DUF2169 domain-containing protein [Polyangiaceae bacterium]